MATETTKQERVPFRPPQFLNQTIQYVLLSPLHRLVSKNLLLVTFKGRKSGKMFTAPVGYTLEGNTVTIFTDHQWYKNLQNNAPVLLRIQGKSYRGTAHVVENDKGVVEKGLTEFVKRKSGAARAYDIKMDANGNPIPETVVEAARYFKLIEIKLDRPPSFK